MGSDWWGVTGGEVECLVENAKHRGGGGGWGK